MNNYQMFKNQEKLLAKIKAKPKMYQVVDQQRVDTVLSHQSNHERVENLHKSLGQKKQVVVSAEIITGHLDLLAAQFTGKQNQQHIQDARSECFQSIITALGLGSFFAAYDRTGGNVDTIHNVRNEVYATEKERWAYENRGEHDSRNTYADEAYKNVNKNASAQRKSQGLEDAYTGEQLNYHDTMDLDHVVPIKTIHDDRGRVLAEVDTTDLANTEENFASTHSTVNRSKQDKSTDEFSEYLDAGRLDRQNKINELQGKGSRTQKEQKKLDSLLQLQKVDTEKLKQKGDQAQRPIDQTINQKYYTSSKFVKATVKASSKEGLKMGAQQAVGIILIELMAGIFDEIKDAFKNGLMGKPLMKSISQRLKRLAKRLQSRWKSIIAGFTGGFITGFISGIITTVINVFKTTGRRLIRLIREGVFTLFSALKTVFFRPKGATYRQGFHEASKLLAAGGIVIGGIALEEVIEKLVMSVPILVPIASIVSIAIVGLISAILMSLAFYLIDKVDAFGVIDAERDEFILTSLDAGIHEKLNDCHDLVRKIDACMV